MVDYRLKIIYSIVYQEEELRCQFNFENGFDQNLCGILSHFKIVFKQEFFCLFNEKDLKFITEKDFSQQKLSSLKLGMFLFTNSEMIKYKLF